MHVEDGRANWLLIVVSLRSLLILTGRKGFEVLGSRGLLLRRDCACRGEKGCDGKPGGKGHATASTRRVD